MTTAGLVLAAGAGTRLGTPKALVDYRGTTLLERAVATLRAGGCRPAYAVLGAGADRVETTGFTAIFNPEWSSGMGSSLRAGLAGLDPGCRAVVVMLVDQPGITAACVREVVRAHDAGARVAMAAYAGHSGHPLCFDRSLWADIAASARGDAGARGFLRAHPDLITEVDCAQLGDPRDIDTPADLRPWRDAHHGPP